MRQPKPVSCCLQWKEVFWLRHQWESRLVSLSAGIEERLTARQFHQPVLANQVLDQLGGLLGEGRIERQPAVDLGPALQHWAVRGGLAPCEERPLASYIRKRLGGCVVGSPKPQLRVCVVQNLLRT